MIIYNPQQKITLTHVKTGKKVFIDENTTLAKWQDDKWLLDKKPVQTNFTLIYEPRKPLLASKMTTLQSSLQICS